MQPWLSRVAEAQRRVSLRARLTVLAGGAAAIVLTATALLLYVGLFSAIDDAVTAEVVVVLATVVVTVAATRAERPKPRGSASATAAAAAVAATVC